eukprot:3952952-Prymnesium_polylepis.1
MDGACCVISEGSNGAVSSFVCVCHTPNLGAVPSKRADSPTSSSTVIEVRAQTRCTWTRCRFLVPRVWNSASGHYE